MKKTFLAVAILFVAASMSSCVVLSTKKYKSLLAKQDSLNTGWNDSQLNNESLEQRIKRLQADTAALNSRLAALNERYTDLDANYAKLRSNSSSEINKLTGDLATREKRLKEVEEVLRKRDEATNQLRAKLQEALLGFTKSGLTVEVKNGKVYVSLTDKLLFPSGSIIIDENGKKSTNSIGRSIETTARY